MIDVSGHLRKERRAMGFVDETVPLSVNCCGMQIFKTQNSSQNRSMGRVDYQLIYIYKGAGHYFLHGEWNVLNEGNLLLFRPHEPQIYTYYASEHPEIYWIHFTGYECEGLIESYHIQNCYIGESTLLKTIFQETIIELQLKKRYYEAIAVSGFRRMLPLIARSYQEALSPNVNDFSIERLVIYLNHHYMDAWSIAAMAEYCKLSAGYFTHVFKERMGSAPMHYLNALRIEKSKDLLAANTMNLTTVASMVGYSNPFHFSRIFKKNAGVSPTEFRDSLFT